MSAITPTAVRTVTASFWLYVAAAVVNVVIALSALLRLGDVPAAVHRAQQQNPSSRVAASALQTGVYVGVALVIVVAVLWSAAVIVFALLMRRGRNWARIVVAVLAALSLVAVGGLGAITVVLAAAAIVFGFLPASNEFFRPMQTRSSWT